MNQLLGFDIPLASVMLVTTKWKNVEPDDGEKRESELNREHWNTLTTPAGEQGGRDGATMLRFGAGANENLNGDALEILRIALRRADRSAGERFLLTCLQSISAIEGKTIRDPDFTRQLTLQLKKSTRISRLLLGMEEGGTNWEVESDPAQHLKESVEDLSRLMSQLTTRDAMRLFALEVSSTFKMIYNRMYL
jgi:hypothetical protein